MRTKKLMKMSLKLIKTMNLTQRRKMRSQKTSKKRNRAKKRSLLRRKRRRKMRKEKGKSRKKIQRRKIRVIKRVKDRHGISMHQSHSRKIWKSQFIFQRSLKVIPKRKEVESSKLCFKVTLLGL